MCKVITISNSKGGTAKSRTAVNLGIGLGKAKGFFWLIMIHRDQ